MGILLYLMANPFHLMNRQQMTGMVLFGQHLVHTLVQRDYNHFADGIEISDIDVGLGV